ncbi:MAG TPA: EAL domain-containing protein, partial [Gammaproteobacteria bacterium]|nr:EAL domain-containing protein [Gammaproteobacteria bacterium]
MHYQPVIDLQSGRLIKAEALARLRDGDELLLPERFLPLFDDEDLFVLYRQGLSQGLNDVQRWASEGPAISLGVNFPPQGLHDARYLEATAAALAARPLPDNCQLYLEMLETETLDLADPERLGSLFEPWLALGVRFAQDDLGAGYSSLLRLHRLPFEEVKIDQALVRLQTQCPDRGTIRKVLAFIAALTHLAHVLGLRVCVEGLENPVLAEAAAAIGADFGQGFSIAEPMP